MKFKEEASHNTSPYPLSYEDFQTRARHTHSTFDGDDLSGFGKHVRSGRWGEIVGSIWNKMQSLAQPTKGDVLLDIGCGASPIVTEWHEQLKKSQVNYIPVDGPEIINKLDDETQLAALVGQFPDINFGKCQFAPPFKYILINSVIQYHIDTTSRLKILEQATNLLGEKGVLFVLDIPNGDSAIRRKVNSRDRRTAQLDLTDSEIYDWLRSFRLRGLEAYWLPQEIIVGQSDSRDALIVRRTA